MNEINPDDPAERFHTSLLRLIDRSELEMRDIMIELVSQLVVCAHAEARVTPGQNNQSMTLNREQAKAMLAENLDSMDSMDDLSDDIARLIVEYIAHHRRSR